MKKERLKKPNSCNLLFISKLMYTIPTIKKYAWLFHYQIVLKHSRLSYATIRRNYRRAEGSSC